MGYLEQLKRYEADTPSSAQPVTGIQPSLSTAGTVIEPATAHARPIYFAQADGKIYGPAEVSSLAKTGSGAAEQFWVIAKYAEQVIWVGSDKLRSRQEFDSQRSPELI